MTFNNKKRKNHYIWLILPAVLLLSGCGSDKFAAAQAEATAMKGRPVLEEYVKSLPEDAHITDVRTVYGGKQGEPSFNGKLPGNIVQADFSTGENHYTAVVNLEDGKIYSNYGHTDPNEMIRGQLARYMDEYGLGGTCKVSGAFYSYAFVSHQVEVEKGDIRDVYVYIDNIPDLACVDGADDFTQGSISGFDIEYEAECDEVFEPEILYKYLNDTGNYRRENLRGDNREYHIISSRREQNRVSGEPSCIEVSVVSEGSPDTMICDVRRWDYKEDDGLCYLYVGGVKSGNIKTIETEEYTEYKCPFELEGSELTYVRDNNNPYEGHLFVKNPNRNAVAVTRYKLENKSSDEKTNDRVDRWELELIGRDELETVKSDSSELFELYIKGTGDKCEFADDKVVVLFE